MSLGELRRLEGLSPFAKNFLEANASLDAWMVVITNGHFELREPRQNTDRRGALRKEANGHRKN